MVTGFCGNCGAPLNAQPAFCEGCGASARPVAPSSTAVGGSGLKIAMIVVAVLFVLGIVSLAGMYYAAHRLIKVAEDVTGVKADDVVRSVREAGSRDNRSAHSEKRDGCVLLSKAEASAILGIEVIRVDGTQNEHTSGEHCDFFVNPGSIAENEEKFKQSVDAVRAEPSTDGDKLPPAAVDMLKTMARGATDAARNGEAPYFAYTVERENGKLAFTAFGIADRLGLGNLSKVSEPLGVGDQSALGMGESRMCIVKGNTALTLDLSQVTGGRGKGIAMAKTMLPRIR